MLSPVHQNRTENNLNKEKPRVVNINLNYLSEFITPHYMRYEFKNEDLPNWRYDPKERRSRKVKGDIRNLILDYETRNIVLYGGGGSGKSYAAYQRAILKCLLIPDRIMYVFRKVLATVRRSVFNGLCRIIKEWNLSSVVKINNTNFTLTFQNGSVIECLGLDKLVVQYKPC